MLHLIDEPSQLRDLNATIENLMKTGGTVAVDTEFFREKTYHARLCVLQLGIDQDQYCVDMLAVDDLDAIVALMTATNVTKVFHAARQDLEVIVQTLGVLPKPIFDTQLAGAFCGFDMQAGYAAMAAEWLGIELPKSQARTDWTKRPLSDEQIHYAAADVAHLEALYLQALERLESDRKLAWFEHEIETYYELDKYLIDPAFVYRRLSGGGLKITQQYTLKALAEWREKTAQKRDIPRTWVLRDDALYELASRRPTSAQKIIEMGVLGKKSARFLAPQVAQIIAEVEVGEDKIWARVEPLTKAEKKTITEMMLHLSSCSQSRQIAQALLGTRKDVESLFRHRDSDKLMHGWRKHVIGESLLSMAV